MCAAEVTAAINVRFVAEPGPAQRASALVRSNPLDYAGLRGECWIRVPLGPPVSLAREISMTLKERLAAERQRWKVLSAYQKFEHAVILVLTALIAVVVVFALWNLVLKVLLSIVSSGFDPTDYEVFQAFFGMIFTVIIALEFKRSLLVVADRRHGIIQVRTVLLIALLAVVRKLMIIDLSEAEAQQVFALAAAILALGAVYWLVREQDRREQHA
jgi:uncharacterized membrane protein (DUF373 family)